MEPRRRNRVVISFGTKSRWGVRVSRSSGAYVTDGGVIGLAITNLVQGELPKGWGGVPEQTSWPGARTTSTADDRVLRQAGAG